MSLPPPPMHETLLTLAVAAAVEGDTAVAVGILSSLVPTEFAALGIGLE